MTGKPEKTSRQLPAQTPSAETSPYEYDVCFSFADEDRAYVAEVAAKLKSLGTTVFYDSYEQAELWGKDLYVHLDEVYRTRARYCVMFISESYGRKLWTNHERRSAQARAFEENREYILPARFDDTPVPGVLPTVGYVSLKDTSPARLAQLIQAKLRASSRRQTDYSPSEPFRRIYYESFDTSHLDAKKIKQQLGKVWLVGNKGAWQGAMKDGLHRLRNLTKPDASLNNRITYSETGGEPVDLNNCRVSVRVRIEGPNDSHSGGGLLFRADETNSNFYSFFLHPGNSVSLTETRNGVLRFLWSREIPALGASEFVALRVAGHESELALFVNDSHVHTHPSDGVKGSPGIHTLSIGTFFFDDFSIYLPIA